MANTKITSHVIADNAVTTAMVTDANITHAKLHATMDLSGKTVTLPAVAIPSASTGTTQSASDNTTKIATTAYVTTAISNLNDSAPAALNTLNEIAAALGDDANYASTTTAAIAAKLPLAGGTMSGAIAMGTAKITGLGNPTANQDAGTKTYIDTADALKLNLSGGTLTGDLILNTTTSLKIPVGTTGQRPSAATGQIRFNSTDGALELYNGSAWTAVGTGSSSKILDTFTGNGSATAYTLSVTPANEDALMVFIDGVYQEKGDYALSNAILTLDTAPASGEKLAVHITTASVHDGTSAVNQQFTGNGSATAYTLSQDPKSENNTQVYINGVYQQKTDYTVSGTTLTFDTAPVSGDIIEVNMFTVATLGNTDTMSEGVSNLYHTTARARGAISVSGNALSYNSSTGVITSAYEENPTFTGAVTASAGLISGTLLNAANNSLTLLGGGNATNAGANLTMYGGSASSDAGDFRFRNGTSETARVSAAGVFSAASLDISGNVDIDGVLETDNLTINGAQGSDGQVLTSTGSGVGWEDVPSEVTISNTVPSSPAEGDIWFNSSSSTVSGIGTKSMAVYNGTAWNAMSASFSATGGAITTSGSYTIHTFTASGTFTPNQAGEVEYLVIAGGGGGGEGWYGSGGGAGGFRTASGFEVTSGGKTVTVGAGGGGASTQNSLGSNGANSVFSTITSVGGGGGASRTYASIGATGGSGGGTNYQGPNTGGAATSGQGYAGGRGGAGKYGSGGGGAGGVGTDGGGGGGYGTNGGLALASSITGTSTYYAGGGGGGNPSSATQPQPSSGGGGVGGPNAGGNGTANKGGGGGGGGNNGSDGGSGGSGIVIIRYLT